MPGAAANSKSPGTMEVTALFTMIKCLRFKATFHNEKHFFRSLPWQKSLSRILFVVMGITKDVCRNADQGLDFCPTKLPVCAYIASLNKSSTTTICQRNSRISTTFCSSWQIPNPTQFAWALELHSCLLSCRDNSKLSILPFPIKFLCKNTWNFTGLLYLF